MSWSELRVLVVPAAAVAALAALESLLSATVADAMSVSTRHDPDRELFGQGLANLASPLLGGIPATAAIARTAVNVRSGARSRLAAVVHSAGAAASWCWPSRPSSAGSRGGTGRGAHRDRGPDGRGVEPASAGAGLAQRRVRARPDLPRHGGARPRDRGRARDRDRRRPGPAPAGEHHGAARGERSPTSTAAATHTSDEQSDDHGAEERALLDEQHRGLPARGTAVLRRRAHSPCSSSPRSATCAWPSCGCRT